MRISDWSSDVCSSDLGQEALVLGVVDRLGLVDQHDRYVVTDGVAALQARVVERVLVLEVQERALVVRAGQDLEELGVEGHRSKTGRASCRERVCQDV